MTTQNKSRKALLGTKLGMTQIWDENGVLRPVTVVRVDTNVVTQLRTVENDGYEAVQLAFGELKENKVTKPMAGHFAKAGVSPRRHVAEIRTSVEGLELGQELTAEVFADGELVDVTGTAKGKGFAGVMKRHGFKGLRMAGRMGHARRTVQNLKVRGVDAQKGYILVNGAIPGPKGAVVLVRSAVKGA